MSVWLEVARNSNEVPGLREAARLWVVGFDPQIAPPIRADLEPLPDIPPGLARERLAEVVNRQRPLASLGVTDAGKLFVKVHTPGLHSKLWNTMISEVLNPPRLGWRVCAHCGDSFIPRHNKGRFCSTTCRVAAHQRRRAK